MKIAVLGAGISGVTIARLLHDKENEVAVYERENYIGGLAHTRIINKYIYDPFGGHIFNSKFEEIKNWVFSFLPLSEWKYTERNAKIWFDKYGFVSYPFELSLKELPIEIAVECVLGYVQARKGKEPDNFQDWLLWNFGNEISDLYMIPYNQKIWAFPLEKMGIGWIRGKMPIPEKKEILMSIASEGYREWKMPHSSFFYPYRGGIQTMVDAISKGIDIRLSNQIEKVERTGERWLINGEESYDTVIATIPLQSLSKVMTLPIVVKEAIQGLKYNHLNTVFFDCEPTDITWCYIPEKKYRAHRIGFQSSLTPYATPNEKVGSAALEIIGNRIDIDDKMLKNGNIVPEVFGAKRVIDSAYSEFAYVIHDLNYDKNTQIIREFFDSLHHFHLLGRWGQWNYNNMDLCMRDAFNLYEREFSK